ncbi:hypothetical protein K457DRAFT_234978 [Linnemannia elongata AG-77]|uniref:Uncharacterized protein n=1 Tax=Linnemannia elongata AG-77 TaxID=1314771 RepID=A0A197JDR8_9FUNG|nr:hypothetical protein K457DRAFT_234978 [Linnemannia elongata AG-77]
MTFRDRIVQENYGVSQPHEMLVVNFIFLLESENQTWGVQGEVHDHVWESMWDCVGKIKINNFESTTIVECHKWAGLAASKSFDEYSKLLRDEPPSFPLLHQVLLQLTSSQQLWTFSGLENEATFIRYLIDPCLNATFGSIKHTSSKWYVMLLPLCCVYLLVREVLNALFHLICLKGRPCWMKQEDKTHASSSQTFPL